MNEHTRNAPMLTIAFSTIADRMSSIRLPEPRPDWEVLILVQSDSPITDAPLRDDLRLLVLNSRGVARSRNAAIDNARGRYLYFADDDILIDSQGLAESIAHLERCGCAVACGRVIDEHGSLRKRYAANATRLTLFNSAKVGTIEMVLRVAAAREQHLRFDENFGAGSENYIGDEYIFIADLLKARLQGHAIPVTVAMHPATSSGAGWGTERDLRVRANVFDRVFGGIAPLIRIGFAVKHWRRIGGATKALKFVLGN